MGILALGNFHAPTPAARLSREVPRDLETPRLPPWGAAPRTLDTGLNEFSQFHSKGQNVSLLLFFHLYCLLNKCC